MLIKTAMVRTPFRISFFGGGTDFKEWYQNNPSSVISTSINLYSYVTVRTLLPLYDHKIRIRYYKREEIQRADDIEHPTVRNVLTLLNFKQSIEIVHYADLPARSGVGSSSTFSVGLIHALSKLSDEEYSKAELAQKATYTEQELNKEIVGCQDQVAVAHGGFNRIYFDDSGIKLTPMPISQPKSEEFQNNLLLFFLGDLRNSSTLLAEQINKIKQNSASLHRISEIVNEADSLFKSGDLEGIGCLLHESWKMKKTLSRQISNSKIDDAYEAGIAAGALGGKILGAGGGGFLLLYANPQYHDNIIMKLAALKLVKFKFEKPGSTILSLS